MRYGLLNDIRKLDEQRYEHRAVVEERDSARAELEELRRKYDELQSKADHAADRIEVLIGIVERSFPELAGSVSVDVNGSDIDGGGQFNQGDQKESHHQGNWKDEEIHSKPQQVRSHL